MVRTALAWTAASLVACNAITDTGKYQVVDCPSGSCSDGGGSSGAGVPPPPPSGDDSGSVADSGVDAKPMCPANAGRITLTVTGSSGRVDEDKGHFSVSASPTGNTQVVCSPPDGGQLRLQATSSATWTGVNCPMNDTCQFSFAAGDDLTITATLP